jgi:PleD family two-component response regulator
MRATYMRTYARTGIFAAQVFPGSAAWCDMSARLSEPSVVIVSRPEHQARRLLYIEDSMSSLTLVEWILDREANVEVITAMRGRRGLELAHEQQPDLIVLDLHLPDMSG